jgi:hypothetical protein
MSIPSFNFEYRMMQWTGLIKSYLSTIFREYSQYFGAQRVSTTKRSGNVTNTPEGPWCCFFPLIIAPKIGSRIDARHSSHRGLGKRDLNQLMNS